VSPLRTSSRIAALLALPAAAVWSPTIVAADEPEPGEECWTIALTEEEVAQGATSEITCGELPPGEDGFAGRSSMIALATHYTGVNATGSSFTVYKSSCYGYTVFTPGSYWDDSISSTVNWSCGSTKHYMNYSHTGTNQIVNSLTGWLTNLGLLNNKTSSIGYFS